MRSGPLSRSAVFGGWLLGGLTVFCWSAFNVAAKYGMETGFRAMDLAALRFIVPGIFLIPAFLLLRGRLRNPLSPGKIVTLVVLGGPAFGFIVVSGYRYAPLSHGLVFGPAAVFAMGSLLGYVLNGERPGSRHLIGGLVMITGLAVLSGFDLATLGFETIKGDLCFLTAGSLWGICTALMQRWKVDPVTGVVTLGSFSALAAVPLYLLVSGGTMPDVSGNAILLQAVMQGLVGGFLGSFFMIIAVKRLGTSKTALLPALTPVTGVLLNMAALSVAPSLAEALGVLLVTAGLIFAVYRPAAKALPNPSC